MGHKGYECTLKEQKDKKKSEENKIKQQKWEFKCFICGNPNQKKTDCPFYFKNKNKEQMSVLKKKLF